MTTRTILETDAFPIVGWAGPTGAMLRPDVMRGRSAAGFTVSHSAVEGDAGDVEGGAEIVLDHAHGGSADEGAVHGAVLRQEALVAIVKEHEEALEVLP